MGQDKVRRPQPGPSSRRAGDDFLQLPHLVAGELQQWGGARGVQEEHSRGRRLGALLPLGRVLAVGPAGLSDPRGIRVGRPLLARVKTVWEFGGAVRPRDVAMPVYRVLSCRTGRAVREPQVGAVMMTAGRSPRGEILGRRGVHTKCQILRCLRVRAPPLRGVLLPLVVGGPPLLRELAEPEPLLKHRQRDLDLHLPFLVLSREAGGQQRIESVASRLGTLGPSLPRLWRRT